MLHIGIELPLIVIKLTVASQSSGLVVCGSALFVIFVTHLTFRAHPDVLMNELISREIIDEALRIQALVIADLLVAARVSRRLALLLLDDLV